MNRSDYIKGVYRDIENNPAIGRKAIVKIEEALRGFEVYNEAVYITFDRTADFVAYSESVNLPQNAAVQGYTAIFKIGDLYVPHVVICTEILNNLTPRLREYGFMWMLQHELTHVAQFYTMGVEAYLKASHNIIVHDNSVYGNNNLELEAIRLSSMYLRNKMNISKEDFIEILNVFNYRW